VLLLGRDEHERNEEDMALKEEMIMKRTPKVRNRSRKDVSAVMEKLTKKYDDALRRLSKS
jgi:hypothetical protein